MYTSQDVRRNTRLLNVSVDFGLDRILKSTATSAAQSNIKMPSLEVPSSSSGVPSLTATDIHELRPTNVRHMTNNTVLYPNGYISGHGSSRPNAAPSQSSSYEANDSVEVDPINAPSEVVSNNLLEGSQESDFLHRAPSPPLISTSTTTANQGVNATSVMTDRRAQTANPSMGRSSSIRLQQRELPPRSYAGYKFTSLDYFRSAACELIGDMAARKEIMRNPRFLEILMKQQNAAPFSVDLKKMLSKEFKEKGSYAVENEFLVEIVALALSELEQNKIFAKSVHDQTAETKKEIEEKMSKLLKEEDLRRQRLEFFADKVLDTKSKLKAINDDRKAIVEQKRLEHIEKEKRDKERKKSNSVNAAKELQAQIEERQTKRNEIINQKMSHITDKYNNKLERMSIAQAKMDMEKQEQLKRRQAAAASASKSFNRAKEIDQEKRINSKKEHDAKDARFHRNFDSFKAYRKAHLDKLSESQRKKIFAANQRRRAKDDEKSQQLELTRIKLTKVDGASEISRSIGSQRKYMMHTTLVNKLGQPGQETDNLDVTPGPGTYTPTYDRSMRCGKFGLAGSRPSSVLAPPPNPGPMDYHPKESSSAQGVIPFMGRGKDDTDILILRAQQLPGPGYYNLPGSQYKGGKIPEAAVPSSIEVLLRQKRGSPGPGYYNLDDNLAPKSLSRIANERGIKSAKAEFSSLFKTLN